MFNSVEYVRNICKERRIAVSALEKACGFSNGYLNPRKMVKLPYDRAVTIADYLSIPVEQILTGETKKAPRKLMRFVGEPAKCRELQNKGI